MHDLIIENALPIDGTGVAAPGRLLREFAA
jgi:hypothetical protein